MEDTPKKVKAYGTRTLASRRTRKSKPYHGPRNVRQTRNIGEGVGPMHNGRAISKEQYRDLLTSGLAGSMQFRPTRDQYGHEHKVLLHDRAQMNRKKFRELSKPWRRDKAN